MSLCSTPILFDTSRESELPFRRKVNRSNPVSPRSRRGLSVKSTRGKERRQSPGASFVSHLGTADNQAATIPFQKTIGI